MAVTKKYKNKKTVNISNASIRTFYYVIGNFVGYVKPSANRNAKTACDILRLTFDRLKIN